MTTSLICTDCRPALHELSADEFSRRFRGCSSVLIETRTRKVWAAGEPEAMCEEFSRLGLLLSKFTLGPGPLRETTDD